MRQLVLDAGLLISLFYAKRTYQFARTVGFEQLHQSKAVLLTRIPIIFEIYKWLLQRIGAEIVQNTLDVMPASLHPVSLNQLDFHELQGMVQGLPDWGGSLEDATVILMAQHYCCPIWTLNYRDFGSFKAIKFWNPGGT